MLRATANTPAFAGEHGDGTGTGYCLSPQTKHLAFRSKADRLGGEQDCGWALSYRR